MELLTVQETAQMLKVSPITIRRYIADGRLAAVRAGKGVRVPKDSVEQFLTPVQLKKKRRTPPRIPQGKPFTFDDPLWEIVGIGASEGPTDISENKYKYLAEAYAPKDDSEQNAT